MTKDKNSSKDWYSLKSKLVRRQPRYAATVSAIEVGVTFRFSSQNLFLSAPELC